jgi:hypothetical protein
VVALAARGPPGLADVREDARRARIDGAGQPLVPALDDVHAAVGVVQVLVGEDQVGDPVAIDIAGDQLAGVEAVAGGERRGRIRRAELGREPGLAAVEHPVRDRPEHAGRAALAVDQRKSSAPSPSRSPSATANASSLTKQKSPPGSRVRPMSGSATAPRRRSPRQRFPVQ